MKYSSKSSLAKTSHSSWTSRLQPHESSRGRKLQTKTCLQNTDLA